MSTKVGFQRRGVFLERTLRPLDCYFFEPLHSSLNVELEVVTERVLGNVHQLCNLSVR